MDTLLRLLNQLCKFHTLVVSSPQWSSSKENSFTFSFIFIWQQWNVTRNKFQISNGQMLNTDLDVGTEALSWWRYQVSLFDFGCRCFIDFRQAVLRVPLRPFFFFFQNDVLYIPTRFGKYSYHIFLTDCDFQTAMDESLSSET